MSPRDYRPLFARLVSGALLLVLAGLALWVLFRPAEASPALCGATLEEARAAAQHAPHRLWIVGLDGLDWAVADPLMEAGRMPALRALVERGVRASPRSPAPMNSPALWTTIATGKPREAHGVIDFVYRRKGSYEEPAADVTIRLAPALWNIAGAVGRSSGIVGWWVTWPPEKVPLGFVVSDRAEPGAPGPATVWPPDLLGQELAIDTGALPPELRSQRIIGLLAALKGAPADVRGRHPVEFREGSAVDGLDRAVRRDLFRTAAALRLLRDTRPSLGAVYLDGPDAVSHFFWKFHEPDRQGWMNPPDEEAIALFGDVVPLYYEFADACLGALVAALGPGTDVVVLSDHGFRAFLPPDSYMLDVNLVLMHLGLLAFEDPALATSRSQRIVDHRATVCEESATTRIVEGFGRRESVLYLNVLGTDPQGVVPAGGRDRYRRGVMWKLRGLRTRAGARVFRKVEIPHWPSAPGVRPPDLLVSESRDLLRSRDAGVEIAFPTGPRPIEEFLWQYDNISGTHRPEALFVAAGPGFRRGETLGESELLDLGPTLLYAAGIPPGADMPGRLLEGLFPAARLEEEPPCRVQSWNGLVQTETSDAPAVREFDGEAYRERLRQLGYIGPEPGRAPQTAPTKNP